MAPDDQSAHPEPSHPAGREPISPAKRKRLQKIFEHGSKNMAQGNHDYASELFSQCVIGDPSNLIYVQNYVGNLQRKYSNNKSGSKLAQFKARGARSAVKKAVARSAWDTAIQHGLKVLAVNPWDVPSLTAMATASDNSGDDEVELFYLKCALDANSKDPAVNRQCAMALAARYEFDQAIACWLRVKQARPDDEEAKREMGRLAVEKTIKKGGYEDENRGKKLGSVSSAGVSSGGVSSGGTDRQEPTASQRGQRPRQEVPPEEVLKRKIDRDPEDLDNYYELAELHLNNERYQDAEDVLAAALSASDGDPDVREKWEDAQLRRFRMQIKRTEDDQTRKKLRRQMIEKELEVYKHRCRRYANNPGFKYELGYRHQLLGEYNHAIRQFQIAQNDARRKGLCLYRLAQCFRQIKQTRLALNHFESALKEFTSREADYRKDALYWAGSLAMSLEDVDAAEARLTELAGLDFTYKDVSALLDKIAELRKN